MGVNEDFGWKLVPKRWYQYVFYHWLRNLMQIRDIWWDAYPKRPRGPITPLERVLMTLLLFLECASFGQLAKWWWSPKRNHGGSRPPKDDQHRRRCFVDFYVFLALCILVFLLWTMTPGPMASWNWHCWLAAYVVAEMLVTTLKVQIVNVYDAANAPQSSTRSIALLLVGYLQVMIGFAIFYLASGGVGASESERLKSRFESFYFSCITIATVGYGDMKPLTSEAQKLVVAEVWIGLVMVVFLLARFIGLPPGDWGRDRGDRND